MNAQVLTLTTELNREDWLKARKQGIGGSDIAAIAGLSPWRSPMAVYLEKIGELPDQEESEAMYWGTRLEDIVAEEFSLRTGFKVVRKNAILQHPDCPWMLANIDRRIVGEKAGLECKTTSAYGRENWENERVPDMYQLQCQWYMAVTGYDTWWIAVLIGGNTFRYTEIKRDEEIINYLIKIGYDFWTLVENRTPPAIDGTDSSTEVLNVLYPPEQATDDEIHLMGAEPILKDFLYAQQMEKEWKEAKEEAANRLKSEMGNYSTGYAGNHKITWKPVISNRVDADALKKAGLYEQYCKQSMAKRFLVKEVKEAK